MKKKFTFLIAALFALMLITLPMKVWADDTENLTFPTSSSNTSYANTGITVNGTDVSINITKGSGTNLATNTDGTRVYQGNSIVFSSSTKKIAKIVFAYKRNSKLTNGITANVGSFTTAFTVGNGTASNLSATWESSDQTTTSITFTVGSGSGNYALQSAVVTFVDEGSDLEESDLALTGAPVALNFDLYNNAEDQVINYTTSSTGAITVSDSDYITTDVDTENKTITVTPNAVTPSTQTITVSQDTDGIYEAGSVTFTVSVANSAPQHTVTYKANGPDNTDDIVDNYHEGDNVTVRAANTFSYAGHAFTKWTTAANGPGTEYDPGEVISNITADIELYAQWEEVNEVVDELTVSWTGVTTNAYTPWSGKTIPNGSDAVYAGKTNKSDNGIGFNNSDSDKGIITTTSGGYVRKVTVTWKTTSSRTLQVYGKNTPYSAVSDLYSSDSQVKGTLLGTIAYGTSTELSITGDYLYLGLRSASGYLSLEPIKITWEQDNAVATSVTIDASGINNNIFNNNTDGGSFSAIVKDNDNNTINNAPVTWSSSDATVATINETTGAVALVATGTTTIEASYAGVDDQYRPSSATYELTIINQDPNAPGTIGNPYTVAQARAAIDADEGLTDVYATGTVSEVIEYSSTYHNITYNISTDGLTTSDQLQAFRGKSYNGNNFTSENDIMVGDVVVVYGTLMKYGDTYEFGQNNQLVSLDRPKAEFMTAVSPANSGTVVAKDSEDQTVASGTQIENGTQLTVTANAADNYRFASWSVSGEGATIGSTTNNPTTFHIALADATVTATFVPTFNVTTSVSPENTGTVTASPNPAIEGETVALTITPESGYALQSLSVYKTGDQSTTVEVTNNQFEMPPYGVTVAATFSAEYTVTYKANGGTGDDIPVKYGAGANVTVAANIFDAPEGKLFSKWNTQADGQGADYLPEATITNIQANYDLYAQWRDIVYHITYNVNGETSGPVNVNYGESIDELPTPSLAPLTFLGWSTTGATGPVNVTAPYTPTGTEENITLYAVFGAISTSGITITPSSTNMPSGYPSSETEYLLEGFNFKLTKVGVFNSLIQMQASNGTMYNTDGFGKITSIVLNYNASSSNSYNITIKGGTAQSPSSGTVINPDENTGDVRTYDFSGYNYSYFYLKNGSGAAYLSSIVINYEATNPVTVITGEESLAEMPATPVVVMKDAVLTFTGTNTDVTKLIIEDGGQLICNNAVQATVQKSVEKWYVETNDGENLTDGWYTIASPVNGISTEYFALNTADLFSYDEETIHWWNAKNTTDGHDFNTLNRGQGYLYANSTDQTLEFAGTMIASNTTVTVPLSYKCTNSNYVGYNLVGNPFTRNLTSSDVIKVGGSNLGTYLIVEGGNQLVVADISANEIKPGRGFFVQATSEKQDIVFNYSSKRGESNNKPSFIRIDAGNDGFMDRAYIQFGNVNTLRKFTLNDNTPKVYVMNNNLDWAATVINETVGEMPVCFKAVTDGQYTISVKPEGVEVSYLHLIDNIAGTDIDLLATPSYTFNAKGDDYESRFRLVFSAKSDNDTNLNEDFAFFSDGQLIVTGEGTLQVVDMMGRVICSEMVNGTTSKAIDAKAGVYVLRLIQGSDVKTQKIVVR